MPYQFYTPTRREPVLNQGLRYSLNVGMTVLRHKDRSFAVVEVPSEDQMTAADRVFLGGHVHLVSDAEAAELSAAGFGEGLVLIP